MELHDKRDVLDVKNSTVANSRFELFAAYEAAKAAGGE